MQKASRAKPSMLLGPVDKSFSHFNARTPVVENQRTTDFKASNKLGITGNMIHDTFKCR